MGRSLVSFSSIPVRFSHVPRSFLPVNYPNQCQILRSSDKSLSGYPKFGVFTVRKFCTKGVLFEIPYQKVSVKSTGPIPSRQLIQVVETAAKTGDEVVMDAVNKPRNITYK